MADTKYTSHDLAQSLRQLAEKLEAKEAVTLSSPARMFVYAWRKDEFIALAKVVGGKKRTENGMYYLESTIGCVEQTLYIHQNEVCRKVTKTVTEEKEVWECDPLLTEAEEQAIA